jgi:ribosomal protein S18 acetylase RimI-like enzyme
MSRQPRPLMDNEVGAVAVLWHDTWHGSHDHLVPRALCEFRTKEYFRRRIEDERSTVHVSGSPGKPIALCIVSGANLDMLFVAPSERGKGIGEELLADAEARMKASGINEAYLYVALGNLGAIRFYERHGWADAGKIDKEFEVAGGIIKNSVLKMVKELYDASVARLTRHARTEQKE